MQYLDGTIFDGPWEHGVRNGKHATFIFKNKDKFDGQYIDDEMHYGTYIERNGNKYIGFFNNGERGGRGKYFLRGREMPIYEGEYHNGKRHGDGVLDVKFGFYEGNFDSDYKHGKGTLTITIVGVYEGQFVLDVWKLVASLNLKVETSTMGSSRRITLMEKVPIPIAKVQAMSEDIEWDKSMD